MEVVTKKSAVFLLGFALLVLAASCPRAFAGKAEPASARIELPDEAVSKKVMDNGLVIIARGLPGQELVAIDIKIAAGSSTEGEFSGSGISHLVEHMLFKGTAARQAGEIEREVKSYGGVINGSASQDLMAFRITVPQRFLRQAAALLKDMLLNASFDSAELEKEKAVILNEIKLARDEPQSALYRYLNETAYTRHPYRHPIIGYEEKFRELKREDLLKYYNRACVPNRMVIAVVGGINPDGALAVIEDEFKSFRSADYTPEEMLPPEPLQMGRRTRREERDINLAYLSMGFHSTGLLNSDLFAMDVLSMILGRGNNSRLNTALFKVKELVHSISCWNYTPKDPGMFVIQAILDRKKLEPAISAVMGQIRTVQQFPVEDAELEGAKRMVLGDYIFSLQTTDGQAHDLTLNYLLAGSSEFSRFYLEGVQSVTKEDITRAAKKYLNEENLTVVTLVPKGTASAKVEKAAPIARRDAITRTVLPSGVRVLVREDDKTPTVAITVAMLGGLASEDISNNGISNMVSRMLLKGTKKRSEREIAGAIESLGGSAKAFNTSNSFGINMEIMKPDIDTALDIIEDVLTSSVFPKEELVREKSLTAAMIKDEDDDMFQRGVNILRKNLFKDSPYGLRYFGTEKSIASLKQEVLLAFYRSYCVPENIVISISGDVETAELTGRLKKMFKNFKAEKANVPRPSGAAAAAKGPKRETVEMQREESLVLLGFESASLKSKDRYAMEALSSVLSGYSGRLFTQLRDRGSLGYSLGCAQKSGPDRGYFVFYAATTRDRIDEARKAILEEVRKIRETPAGDDEVSDAKRELITGYRMGRQANIFFSSNSAADELYGLGYDSLYKYTDNINAVTGDDIKRAASKYLDPGNCSEVVILSK